MATYEVDTVCFWGSFGEVMNSLTRPVRDQNTLIWVNYNTNKWKYVWMPKVSPNDSRFAEILGRRSENISGGVHTSANFRSHVIRISSQYRQKAQKCTGV